MVTIPIPESVDAASLSVDLDGVTYRLGFRWNARASAWFMSLATEDETPIASGIKVVADWPLLRGVRGGLRPPGELLAVDTSGQQTDPGRDDLGRRVELVYVEAV